MAWRHQVISLTGIEFIWVGSWAIHLKAIALEMIMEVTTHLNIAHKIQSHILQGQWVNGTYAESCDTTNDYITEYRWEMYRPSCHSIWPHEQVTNVTSIHDITGCIMTAHVYITAVPHNVVGVISKNVSFSCVLFSLHDFCCVDIFVNNSDMAWNEPITLYRTVLFTKTEIKFYA